MPLPEEYSFTYYGTTEQQAKASTEYLLEQYKAAVGMDSPALALFGDYNIYTERGFSYAAYENSGGLTDRILGITMVPEEIQDEKYIARVELIYRAGRYDSVFMPYYRF